jgi:hypothetical protein
VVRARPEVAAAEEVAAASQELPAEAQVEARAVPAELFCDSLRPQRPELR